MTTAMRVPRAHRKERGVALVTALLLLALLTGLSVAMFLAANSDLLTNGYYRNFRGSYYAADSGLTIVRQDLKNKIWANMVTADKDTPPLPSGVEATILSQLKAAWASDSTFKSITDGAALGDSVPARFRIEPNSFTFELVSCSTDVTPTTCAGVTSASKWVYQYKYHMVAIGQAGPSHQNRVEESGTLTVTVPVAFTTPKNFSGYGLYIQSQPLCPDNSTGFAPGTIYGSVYTEGCFTFGTGGQVTFKDQVGCGAGAAGYQFGSSSKTCVQKAGISAQQGKTTIAPDFQGGLYFNVAKPDLPDSDFSQKQAVLDGKGLKQPSSSDWNSQATSTLVDASNSPYKNNSSSGVYLPVSNGNIVGGGIYVAGNASVTLSTGTAADGSPQQIYTIVNNGNTTTVTVQATLNPNWKASSPYDPPYTLPGAGTTTIQSGGKKETFQGVPTQTDDVGNVIDNATMLYVNGSITSLSGQVQDDTALTITAANDVTITGDVKYKTKPVTTQDNESLTSSCCKGQPADTVVPGNDRGQALGIFTANGDIYTTLAKSGNLEIDASLATISKNGDGGLKIPDSSAMINYLTILGGRIHNNIYSTSKLGQRNVYFDRRFGKNLAPPFFPATTLPGTIPAAGSPTVEFHRQQWVNQTSY